MDRSRDVVLPWILIAIGSVLFVGMGSWLYGILVSDLVLEWLVFLAVSIPVGVMACLVTAKIMGVGFGLLTEVVLKLTGVFAFSVGATTFVPLFGWLCMIALMYALMMILFELEPVESSIFVIVVFVINLVLGMFLLSM